MKFVKGVLVCSFLILILLGVVSSGICSVKLSCESGETKILKLSSLQNAHGELASQNNYANVLCCTGITSTACSGSNKILGLSATTNAHAEVSSLTNYNAPVCASGITCNVGNGACSSGQAILSLSSNTNAHLSYGNVPSYNTKICCDIGGIVMPKCSLKSASWSKASAIEGESVALSLTSYACSGKKINFKITKTDGTFVAEIKEIVIAIDDSASANWKVIYLGTGNTDLKYIFTATDDAGNFVKSGELIVKKGICGDGIRNTPVELAIDGCDDGNIINGDSCSAICKLEKPFTPTSCSDIKISNYDDSDILSKIENICNTFDSTAKLNGCDSICKWSGNVCEIKPDPMDSSCADIYGCEWEEIYDKSCSDNVDFIKITYKNIGARANDPKCSIAPQTIPCSETTMLPFFGFYQAVAVLIIIFLIYWFLILRKKKKRK